jgi:hypothetical protein
MAGNALHALFAFAQAHVKHAITTTFQESTLEDQSNSITAAPRTHMRNQAIQIRQGKPIPAVTALLSAEFEA